MAYIAYRVFLVAAVVALAAAALLWPPTEAQSTPETPETDVYEEIAPEPAPVTLNPALVPVCACESRQGKYGTPTHYEEDGVTVLLGRENPNDIGMCQINSEPRNGHVVAAEAMGMNIWEEQGNIRYANWLYEQQGLQPWNWSRPCWE